MLLQIIAAVVVAWSSGALTLLILRKWLSASLVVTISFFLSTCLPLITIPIFGQLNIEYGVFWWVVTANVVFLVPLSFFANGQNRLLIGRNVPPLFLLWISWVGISLNGASFLINGKESEAALFCLFFTAPFILLCSGLGTILFTVEIAGNCKREKFFLNKPGDT